MKLTIDFETRSIVTELGKTGAWPYAEHPTTRALCMALKADDNPPVVWVPAWVRSVIDTTQHDIPLIGNDSVCRMLGSADLIEAHNVQFELAVWFHVLHRREGFPELPMHKLRDSAAVAAVHSLPRPLGQACEVMGVEQQKDNEGKALMLKMCKPRAPRKAEWEALDQKFGDDPLYKGMKAAYVSASKEKLVAMCLYAVRNWHPRMEGMFLWHEDPEDIVRICKYCMQDVEAEHALSSALGPLPDMELPVFQHDLVINTRGIRVDTDMARAALRMIAEHERRLLSELDALTNGTVRSVKQIDASRNWLASRGVQMDNMAADTVSDALKGEMPADARRFLEIRQSLGKSSTAKYEAALHQTCSDGRLRGFAMYHGASTGRWSGKGIQLQNLPRGVFDMEKEESEEAFWKAVDIVRGGDLDALMLEFGDPMPILSSVIRPLVTAAPGHEFIVADFSAIEGRGLAWLAEEEWVLEAYRAYDRKEGPDMYMVTAGKILGKPGHEVTKTERKNPGKIADLACFAPDTRVLTSNGVKGIAEVTTLDLLWDGTEWVRHDGVIYKGVREVIEVCDVKVTPDHLIRTGRTWKRALELATRECTLFQALETGSESLPSLGPRRFSGGSTHSLPSWYSVLAERNHTGCTRPTYGEERPRVATCAQRSRAGRTGRTTSPTLMCAPMMSTAAAFSTALRHALAAATTLTTGPTPTTAGVGYTCATSGGMTVGHTCPIWSHLKGGTTRILNWIALMLTGATNRAISALSPGKKTPGTNAPSKTSSGVSKSWSPVFDILNSGPRNCFTILSDRGPLVVHNCGYYGGPGAIANFGGKCPKEDRPKWIIEFIRRTLKKGGNEEAIGALEAYISSLGLLLSEDTLRPLKDGGWPYPTEDDIFELWARDVVTKWRDSRPKTKALWHGLEAAAINTVETGESTSYGRISYHIKGPFLVCVLPSGRPIHYPFPRLIQREIAHENGTFTKLQLSHMTVDSTTKQWVRRFAHGGVLTENVIQALCRDILANANLNLEQAGFPVILHVHDESGSEVPTNTRTLDEFKRVMTIPPWWADGFPIAAAGWVGERYKKD